MSNAAAFPYLVDESGTEHHLNSEQYEYQIENLIRRLRTKIERDPNAPLMLLTVRGQGYKLLAHREA